MEVIFAAVLVLVLGSSTTGDQKKQKAMAKILSHLVLDAIGFATPLALTPKYGWDFPEEIAEYFCACALAYKWPGAKLWQKL